MHRQTRSLLSPAEPRQQGPVDPSFWHFHPQIRPFSRLRPLARRQLLPIKDGSGCFWALLPLRWWSSPRWSWSSFVNVPNGHRKRARRHRRWTRPDAIRTMPTPSRIFPRIQLWPASQTMSLLNESSSNVPSPSWWGIHVSFSGSKWRRTVHRRLWFLLKKQRSGIRWNRLSSVQYRNSARSIHRVYHFLLLDVHDQYHFVSPNIIKREKEEEKRKYNHQRTHVHTQLIKIESKKKKKRASLHPKKKERERSNSVHYLQIDSLCIYRQNNTCANLETKKRRIICLDVHPHNDKTIDMMSSRIFTPDGVKAC